MKQPELFILNVDYKNTINSLVVEPAYIYNPTQVGTVSLANLDNRVTVSYKYNFPSCRSLSVPFCFDARGSSYIRSCELL